MSELNIGMWTSTAADFNMQHLCMNIISLYISCMEFSGSCQTVKWFISTAVWVLDWIRAWECRSFTLNSKCQVLMEQSSYLKPEQKSHCPEVKVALIEQPHCTSYCVCGLTAAICRSHHATWGLDSHKHTLQPFLLTLIMIWKPLYQMHLILYFTMGRGRSGRGKCCVSISSKITESRCIWRRVSYIAVSARSFLQIYYPVYSSWWVTREQWQKLSVSILNTAMNAPNKT